jgi:hypothetical protein
LSTQTLNASIAWNDIFQALEENNCQPKLLCSSKLSFIVEEKIKTFHNNQKLNEFIAIKPAQQKILKGILQQQSTSSFFL